MNGTSAAISFSVHDLHDIELAVLLCLITDQHCIVQANAKDCESVAQELELVARKTFGLSCSSVNCHEGLTLEDFGRQVLTTESDNSPTPEKPRTTSALENVSFGKGRSSSDGGAPTDKSSVANIVIAKDLNHGHEQIQIQALELIRTRRIYTRTAVHTAPKHFLLVALLKTDGPALASHLNDHFFLSHTHERGAPLRSASKYTDDDSSSTSSVIRTPQLELDDGLAAPRISRNDLVLLSSQAKGVRMSAEIRAYMHNLIAFLRLHRAVAGGVSALASRYLDTLSRALAPLHGLEYVPPSLVTLAMWKVYAHRIVLTDAENERSIQWGSSIEAVDRLLDGTTVPEVISAVLDSVESPL